MKERALNEAVRTEFTTSDGLTLVGDMLGLEDAPLVILMHGGGQTRHSWAGAMRALAGGGYRVVNLDARGHGESDWSPDGAYELDERIADVHAVLSAVKGEGGAPYALVGASMGGLTSIHAVGEGAAPSALVLVDVVPDMEPKGISRIVGFLNANHGGFASLEDAADAVAAYYPDRPRPKDPSGLMKNLRLRDDGRLYWHWDPVMFEFKDSSPFRASIDRSTVRLGQRADLPTLIVRGLLSDMISDKGIANFRANVPHAELSDIAGAGHMVAGDKNDAFNEAVIGFLRQNMPV